MKMQAPTARQPVSIGRSKGSTAVNLFNVSLLGKNFLRAYLRWQLRFSHQERVWLRGLRRPQGRRGRSSRPQRERNVRSRVGFLTFRLWTTPLVRFAFVQVHVSEVSRPTTLLGLEL